MRRGHTLDEDFRDLILSLVEQQSGGELNATAAKIIEDALWFQDPSARPIVESLLQARGIKPPHAHGEAAL